MLYDDYNDDLDPANRTTFGSSHIAVMKCFWGILREHFSYSEQDKNLEKKYQVFNGFLDPLSELCCLEYLSEYHDSYTITAQWYRDLLYPEDFGQVNAISEFPHGEKYLVLAHSLDWNFYDDSSQYEFPAVFYSPVEMQMWFLWALRKKMSFQPRLKPFFTKVIEGLLDEKVLMAIFKQKLSGELSWDYGPARIHEPDFNLWHQRARDEAMNNWILQWLD